MSFETGNYSARFASAFDAGTTGNSAVAAIQELLQQLLSSLSQSDMTDLLDGVWFAPADRRCRSHPTFPRLD